MMMVVMNMINDDVEDINKSQEFKDNNVNFMKSKDAIEK